MVKLIMGLKGSGKTKKMMDLLKTAIDTESGDIIFIDKDKKLIYDIPYTVRLVHGSDYGICSNAQFKGFVSGIHAGNYDITHVFIDNFFKMLDDTSNEAVTELLAWLDEFSEKENVKFTISASADISGLPEGITKFF
ncbi:MAG: ATP-binding protein [Candidatus Heteroscillospira sp.]|jgi:hypothetical protein